MSFYQNTSKPIGIGGKIMLMLMNKFHSPLTKWALSHIEILDNYTILDAGCGGGANIKRMLNQCSTCKVYGLDYSELSVMKSKQLNKNEINNKRCEIIQSNILKTPYDDSKFNLITAIETIYFWPTIQDAFKEVYRILKPNGIFLICNELTGDEPESCEKWEKIINGMTSYKNNEIIHLLENAGFKDIKIDKKNKNWVCFVAEK